jgi:hypothetical protein
MSIKDMFGERDSIGKEVDNAARLLGADVEWGNPPAKFDKDVYGICFDCVNLRACKSKYGRTYARCYEFELALNSSDPVIECTSYKKKGELSLFDMKEIAIILEPGRRQAGFIVEEK